jgi:hypothetical protein
VTVRRLAIVAILAVCLGAPIIELFDQWDHTVQDGNDTEANVVIVALCVGLALSVTGVVVVRIRVMSLDSCVRIVVSQTIRVAVSAFATPIPTVSPPTPLRV